MKIYICSFKFAPGLYKEFKLLGNLFVAHGMKVEYLVAKNYEKFFQNEKEDISYFTNSRNSKDMFVDLFMLPYFLIKIFLLLRKNQKKEKTKFLFYNPHPLNPVIQLAIKLFSKNVIITVLHEPYKTKRERMEYGALGYIFFTIVNLLQIISISISDKIITMSPYGKDLFLKYFPQHRSKLIQANLLLPEQQCITTTKREYFSFIGRVNKGKGINDFIKVINHCLENELENYKFLLITSSNINEYLIGLKKDWNKILTLINHQNITDDEIKKAICSSKAVLILHQTASQSGVLPLAYQLNTPIIARKLVAFTQYFKDSGQLIGIDFTPEELLKACDRIELNFYKYSENAYNIYKENFSEKNFTKFYKEILNA